MSGFSSKSLFSERGDFGDVAPSRKGSLAQSSAEVGGGGFRIGDVKEVRDLIVNRRMLKPMEIRQLALLREGDPGQGDDFRGALPQRPVPPAVGRDQLLPLLGRGHLDRVRPRTVPPQRRHP